MYIFSRHLHSREVRELERAPHAILHNPKTGKCEQIYTKFINNTATRRDDNLNCLLGRYRVPRSQLADIVGVYGVAVGGRLRNAELGKFRKQR